MVVQHNLTALNSNRMLGLNNASLSKMTEKLSSGYRVNRAADDAAGLAISEKMRRQIRGLTQASANCQDGVSLCQIADGALNEVQDMLKRCEELAVQAANDTNTTEDRAYIQMELDALEKEIDRVHETTVFNNQNIFSDLGITPTFIAPGTSDSGNVMVNTDGSLSLSTPEGIYIEVGMVDSNGNRIPSVDAAQATGTANNSSISSSGLAQFAKKAAANAVAKLASHYPTLFSSAATQGIQVGLELSNIDGKNKTLASASASLIPSGSDAVMSYRLKIDTTDYPISAFDSYTDAQKADLAAVIAHEMTHVMMFDTVSNKMLGKDTFPLWFIEGMAQTSSGDNGWVSNSLNPSSSDNAIRSYMSNLVGSPYGAGYLATLYLGMSASGESMDHFDQNYNVAADISKGLDKVLTDVAKGKSFDDAIKDNTNGKFTSQSDFQSKFMSGEADALNFVKKVLNARGTAGAGSILYELNGSEVNCFGPDYLNSDYTTYMVNPDNTWYSNATGSDINWPQMGGRKHRRRWKRKRFSDPGWRRKGSIYTYKSIQYLCQFFIWRSEDGCDRRVYRT